MNSLNGALRSIILILKYATGQRIQIPDSASSVGSLRYGAGIPRILILAIII